MYKRQVLATGIGGVVIGGLLHPVEPARIVARVARTVARPAAQRHRLRKVEVLNDKGDIIDIKGQAEFIRKKAYYTEVNADNPRLEANAVQSFL